MSYMYAQPTNNPFLNEQHADASSRYPDINNIGSPAPGMMSGPSQWQPQQSQYGQPNQGYSQSGFMQPQPQQQQMGYMQNPQPGFTLGMGMPQQTPYSPSVEDQISKLCVIDPPPFSRNQQYSTQPNQFSTMQYQQPQYPMSPVGSNPTGYPFQSQQPSTYNAVADLDPYSGLGSAPFSTTQSQLSQSQPQPQSQPQYSASGSQHGDHPRTFVQKWKTELEQWDTAAWKQVMVRIADLRSAWEVRKRDLNGALEGARFNGWTPNEVEQCQIVSPYVV